MLLSGALLLTVAQAGFALASSYPWALVARVFVGMGDAMTFICVLRLVSSGSAPRRIPFVTQLTGTLGQTGALVAAVPMTWACGHLGWTSAYLLAASVGGPPGRRRPGRLHDAPGAGRLRGPRLSSRAGPRQPGRLLVAPRHPARVLDALLDAVQRDHAHAAVGLPFFVRGEGRSRPPRACC